MTFVLEEDQSEGPFPWWTPPPGQEVMIRFLDLEEANLSFFYIEFPADDPEQAPG